MTEDKDNKPIEAPKDETPVAAPAKKKSGMIRYIIFGGIGLVAVLAVSVATVLLLGGSPPKPSDSIADAADSTVSKDTLAKTPRTAEDSMQRIVDSLTGTKEDTSILAEVKRNLAALDYRPDSNNSLPPDSATAVKDSLTAMSWIEKEKARLGDKEKALTLKETELNKLDKQVSSKLIKLEQATTTRVSELARLYDGMEARTVANMMANLDDTTIVSLLPRMKQKNASAVLGLMPPQRAAKLSKQMIEVAEN